MADIAVLGYGTIGSGVVEVINTNQNSINEKAAQSVAVKRVLDLRDFSGSPAEHILTKDFNDILNDDSIAVVVETMGGITPAYEYVKKLLLRGKSVITSNKELVAKYGPELLAIARANAINFLFEASVGGGIPIIRSLNRSLTADKITEISGIMNGTTNYILTEMTQKGRDFGDVLKDAQNKGYAEKDPSADVLGHDACRKIAILISLATGRQVDFEDIYTEGIDKITKEDIKYAKLLGGVIKLIANAKITETDICAAVSPVIIFDSNPLFVANDVFNAILLKGNVIGDVMFYGRGAGKLPTASAVVADIVDCVRHLDRNILCFWSGEKRHVMDIGDNICRKLVRVRCEDADKAKVIKTAKEIFGCERFYELEEYDSELSSASENPTHTGAAKKPEFAFISEKMKEKALDNLLETLAANTGACEIVGKLRIGE